MAHAARLGGAGNISNAVKVGYWGTRRWYDARGGLVNAEIKGLVNPPADTFTMSGYVSFIAEFGLLAMILLAAVILVGITVCHAWSRKMLCWVVLVGYLYIQFEGYAFYALPLLVFVLTALKMLRFIGREEYLGS